MRRLLPIVEGDAEIRAVPVLVRRILYHNGIFDVKILHPHLRGDINAVRKNFSRFIKMAMKEAASVLWVLDCDDGCPVTLVRELKSISNAEYKPYPIEYAFIVKEFESLFLSDAERTRKRLSIKQSIPFPADPESIRGVKEWLSQNMPPGQIYKPTIHQEALSSAVDLDVLRGGSPSYRHFERALLRLVARGTNDVHT